ncbi:hypothetical protein K0504_10080 [Neiella marina]|uniref:Uncharacterized protein n=1 Tax=Neiella holothuriorum TaxID=2870530 RepID=A0ABS7EGC2_9GAMM|nr:hypothetical protein [Neiella holothuriorum]MBW8191386.1 hypothetical protein [Neiella holothuriorum]
MRLFVCDTIVRKYNCTAAFVFSHIAFHIIRNQRFDASPAAIETMTGVSKTSSKRYVKKFIDDGLLEKVDGSLPFRDALQFNNCPENHDIIEAYKAAFTSSTSKEETNQTQITAVPMSSLKGLKMTNKKAECERSKLYIRCYLRDKMASANLNYKNTNSKINARYLTSLARTFGFAVNTIKAILNSLAATNVIKLSRNAGQLIIQATSRMQNIIQKKMDAMKKSAKQQIEQNIPAAPPVIDDIPSERYRL